MPRGGETRRTEGEREGGGVGGEREGERGGGRESGRGEGGTEGWGGRKEVFVEASPLCRHRTWDPLTLTKRLESGSLKDSSVNGVPCLREEVE